jgi:hypothetical protein
MKHLFLYILLVITSSLAAQKPLEYHLSVGDNFTVNQEAKQLITQDINGVDQIIENDLLSVMHFEVIEATKENYTLIMRFKRLKMLMSSPSLGELSNSDTQSADSSDVTNMLFKGLLNVPVTIVMEKTGKIVSVTGGDKLIDNMFTSAGIDQPEIIEASKGQMEKQFGSDALSNSFEQMTYFYPVDAVSVGNEWTNSYIGNMSAQNKWKLNETNLKSVTISGTSNTTMSTIDENVSMSLSGTQKTIVTINPKNGLFKEVTVTGENKGITLVKAQNMNIPTSITSTITYKISQ